MEKKEIYLSSIEATAYWWINSIKDRVREIAIGGAEDEDEIAFVKIFFQYTEKDWREVYLQLEKYISLDVFNYICKKQSYGIDAFSQDTAKGGHNRLNEELSTIIDQTIPDIRLASRKFKDSIIYTNNFYATVWYKSGGMTKLSARYEPSYILTGDEKAFHFYNLVLATIVALEKQNSAFKSTPIFRESFCREFIATPHTEEQIEEVIEMFNNAFNKISERGLILGRAYEKSYFPSLHDIDFVGLQPYQKLAEYYANVILLREYDENAPSFYKILKEQEKKERKNDKN